MAGYATFFIAPRKGDALLLVELQKDFLAGANLPIADGYAAIPPLNARLRRFRSAGSPVVVLLLAAMRARDTEAGNGERVVEEMKGAGAAVSRGLA